VSLGRVRIAAGAEGEALELSGETMKLVIDRAFAPGAPMSFELEVSPELAPELARGPKNIALEARTIGSKRQPDGRFEVRVRLINLRREDRLWLAGKPGVPRAE
jgi:hypothetical protein